MIKFGNFDYEDDKAINFVVSCPEETSKQACEDYCRLADDISRRGFNVYVPEYEYIKELLKDSDQIEKKETLKPVKAKVEKVKNIEETEVKGE